MLLAGKSEKKLELVDHRPKPSDAEASEAAIASGLDLLRSRATAPGAVCARWAACGGSINREASKSLSGLQSLRRGPGQSLFAATPKKTEGHPCHHSSGGPRNRKILRGFTIS
jgi:hypothetical protein